MGIKFTNFASSQLAAGLSSGATSVVLESGQGARFPTLGAGDYFYATIEDAALNREVVRVTARTSDTLTVVRGQDNTTARVWAAGDTLALRLNAAALADVLAIVGITADQTVTLTNKTISFGSNTLTDVASINTAQTLTNKTISGGVYTDVIDMTGSQRGGVTAVAALDINCSLGNYFTKTINTNSTFTFSNAPASRSYSFTLELTHTNGSVTWPAAVRWPSNIAPALAISKTHLFMFVTDDGGTSWRGGALVDYNN